MATKKTTAAPAEKPEAAPEKVRDGIYVTREKVQEALTENMRRKLGSDPIEGQLDDLWSRLGGS